MSTGSRGFDVGLIVPLSEEFDYVRELLPPQQTIRRGHSFYFALKTPADAPRMVAVVLDEMGEVPAAVATERLLAEFAVREVAMVGIAGALKDDVGLGDVVIASKVDYYQHAAKAIPGNEGGIEFRLAGNVFQGPPGLLQVARNLPRMPEYAKMLDAWKSGAAARREQLGLSSELAGAAAHYVVAPIASGDVVGAAREFARWLHDRRDRTLTAIEMEAAGAAYAAYARIQGVPMLVVRGISDFADERKAEFDRTAGPHGKGAWRRYATMNAVDLLIRVLTCEAMINATPDVPRSDVLPATKGIPPVTNLEELERLVVARYPSTAALERLLANTGIDPRLLDMSGAVLVVAHRGIQAAQQQGKLQHLLAAMRRDYPQDAELRRLSGDS
jgi:nucleoside phosphorylase